MTLVGKWVCFSDAEYIYEGRVTDVIGDSVLIRMNSPVNSGPPVSRLFAIGFLAHGDDIDCFFFDTEEEFTAWKVWVETPSEDETKKFKLINLKKDR